MSKQKEITLAFTGASGAPYGLRLLQALVAADYKVHLLVSSAARVVFATEHEMQLSANPEAMQKTFVEYCQCEDEQIKVYGKEEWFSPVASGSAAPKQMVVCPCSTSTLSSVATGASNNLIERAADVVIKEKGQLIMVVREMPLSSIHLQNMLTLSNLGVTMMPASPGFYHQPKGVDDLVNFVVARILDHLGIEQTLMERWGYNSSD
ncbi:UbiX family flavin prenyltransferase [Paraneptunicella aestuarii]|uniref:flavin prenyltransferase UbiX n=1 Tax=Paraneptunicella aestuarii TaxID=2831148 RepID=UPI001E577A24|nr:flavin prenyltransferase UbiX [Paraneptunicella aestuarii]UAA38699.1 UbiX family flavin prenyltransferase [Paraneptunicella aestuarii]